jgi:hypothetical protein
MALGFARTIIAGMILFLGGIIFIFFLSLGNNTEPTDPFMETIEPRLACTYTNTTPREIPIYSAPFSAEILEMDLLGDSFQLTVTKLRETHAFVTIRGNYGGWVELNLGQLTGDCELPLDESPLTDFATVCFFTPTEQTTLYTDSTLQNVVQSLQPDQSYVIIGQTENTYQIRISSLIGGYADRSKGLSNGACGLVPMVE